MNSNPENLLATLSAQFLLLLSLLSLGGCLPEDDTVLPAPQELTQDAVGYYCQMTVADHPGPKAQIFLRNSDKPVWFPSVRDAFAFLMLPGEAKTVKAIFVSKVQINDRGEVLNWEKSAPAHWINGKEAIYVIESRKKGGMNLNEVVPFSDKTSALKFINKYAGRIVTFSEVSADYIFADPGGEQQNGAEEDHVSVKKEANLQ